MKKWLVTVQVTVERVYEVEAPDEKAAMDASVDAIPTSETDIDSETRSVVEVRS
jgi:hypothetical protein